MKHKIFGILLFFLFVAPLATTFFILQYQKKQVRSEVKCKLIANIDKEKLVLLKFTKEEKERELHWKHNKEFRYKGKMYDIVNTEIDGNITSYWCWMDDEETKLNKQLNELLSVALGNNPKRQESKKGLFNFFKSLFFNEPIINKPILFKEEYKVFFYENGFYTSVCISPSVPPPNCFNKV